jgi:hypothetical protein
VELEQFIREHFASNRKLRLLSCACCRYIWELLADSRSRRLVEAAEQFAEGLTSTVELAAADLEAIQVTEFFEFWEQSAIHAAVATFGLGIDMKPFNARLALERSLCATLTAIEWDPRDYKVEAKIQCTLIHDIFGNPFRPVAFDPRWRTADSVGVARGIYEDRAFERMPILADALMDAGCADEQVLGHCRGAGPHVRGCWVVDLVLGKE